MISYAPKIENGDFNVDILEPESDEFLKDIEFVKATFYS